MLKIDKIYEDGVNIVYATNNKYAKYMIVSIESLLERISPDRFYEIIVLGNNIVEEMQVKIKSMAQGYPNVSIRVQDVSSVYEQYDAEKLFCHIYFSKEMYLRLFIPQVLQDYDKAIYLDCDTIVQADVAELFDMDFEGNLLCAARDYNSIVNVAHFEKVHHYFKNMLGFTDMRNYINSGVLLMNLQPLREIDLVQKTFELLDKYKELLYPDQDLLNLICRDKIKIMHNGWNFVFGINCGLVHDNHFLDMAIDWSKGLADQKIIHYISEQKPWNTPEMCYGDIWWSYAKKTPIYQELLKDYFDAHPEKLKD